MILWKLLLGFMLTALCLLLIAVCVDRVSKGDEPVELPYEILSCTTDADCEYKASIFCSSLKDEASYIACVKRYKLETEYLIRRLKEEA